jgi:P27 family predicted phage terminase small subunit
MAGQPRKPTKIRKLEGVRGHSSPLPKNEPEGIGRPRAPSHLSLEAQARWRDIVESLPVELLTRADEVTLERAAEAWAVYRETAIKLDASGLLVKGRMGEAIKNPLLSIMRQASADLDRCSWQLGLSPAARCRITSPERASEDPLALLLGPEGNAWRTDGKQLDS